MTQYLMTVHAYNEVYDTPPTAEQQAQFAATGKFNDELQAEGSWVFAGGLGRISSATTVDGTGAEVIVTDGPYMETKEYLGGFWIVEAPDLDAALKLAARGSKACGAKVEVRPFEGPPE